MPTKLLIGCADSHTISPCHASFAHRFLVPHCDASIVRELGHRNWRSKKNLEQYYVVRVPAKTALEFAGLGRDNSFLYSAEWWYRGTKTS